MLCVLSHCLRWMVDQFLVIYNRPNNPQIHQIIIKKHYICTTPTTLVSDNGPSLLVKNLKVIIVRTKIIDHTWIGELKFAY